jgi:flagellar hook-associated protein 1 FlgK
MAIGFNAVLSMGKGALFASQAAIQVTGNNISNVNTPGYSRQAVMLQENYSVNYNPGQVPQGVKATEIFRYFDRFVENAYLQQQSTAAHSQILYDQLRYVENIFNEANAEGIGTALTALFDSWNKLASSPDSTAAREALLATANTFTDLIRSTDTSLRNLEDQMNKLIREDVDTANRLIQEIAALNREIKANYLPGRNNPNQLMDERDQRVRQLAEIIDISVEDRGPGADYMLSMKNGYPLVQHDIPFALEVRGAGSENNLVATSTYAGKAQFSGSDSHEYTLEMVNDGDVATGPNQSNVAQFRVSVDGGRTWLTDDNGQVRLFEAGVESERARVGNLDIWFDAGTMTKGDTFVISPKMDVYWIEPTVGPISVSTQVFSNGAMNDRRITGGSLGGYLDFRDNRLGEYRDRLQSFADSVAWEVNRLHSQGSGLTPLSNELSTYRVGRADVPLGDPKALFKWSDRLQAGSITFAVYGPDGKPIIPYPGSQPLTVIFDPALNSLEDVAYAINQAEIYDHQGTVVDKPFVATIYDGKLQISTKPINGLTPAANYTFAITDDTSGLAAALGINTFFGGDSSGMFSLREGLAADVNHVNAGRLNGAGEINIGDNITAREIANLASKSVTVRNAWSASTRQSLPDYYAGLVARIGADTASANFAAKAEKAVAQDLYDRQEEISGVNLDEEMTNLIKFQASYKAAAKLITTADEMLQTLLGMKQ